MEYDSIDADDNIDMGYLVTVLKSGAFKTGFNSSHPPHLGVEHLRRRLQEPRGANQKRAPCPCRRLPVRRAGQSGVTHQEVHRVRGSSR